MNDLEICKNDNHYLMTKIEISEKKHGVLAQLCLAALNKIMENEIQISD